MNKEYKRRKVPRRLKKKLDKRLKYCAEGFYFYYDEDRVLPAGKWLDKYRNIYNRLYKGCSRVHFQMLFPKRNL